ILRTVGCEPRKLATRKFDERIKDSWLRKIPSIRMRGPIQLRGEQRILRIFRWQSGPGEAVEMNDSAFACVEQNILRGGDGIEVLVIADHDGHTNVLENILGLQLDEPLIV